MSLSFLSIDIKTNNDEDDNDDDDGVILCIILFILASMQVEVNDDTVLTSLHHLDVNLRPFSVNTAITTIHKTTYPYYP